MATNNTCTDTTDTSKVDPYELETTFDGRDVIHTIHKSNLATEQRTIEVKERWEWVRDLGAGAYGEVSLQEEKEGEQVRAVKKISRIEKGVDYSRELATLAKLKDVSVLESRSI